MRFWWLIAPVAIALLVWFWAQPKTSLPDDTNGGLSNSSLFERCKSELENQVGINHLAFPNPAEIANQISSSSEEKRWDGWVQTATEKLEFSCRYTAATDLLVVEVIR